MTRCLGMSLDFFCSRNAVVLLKPSFGKTIICEHRDGTVEAEGREYPPALRAGPSSEMILFHPNHMFTHRFFLVSLLEQN